MLEFDSSGKFLQAWGAPGTGYEWFRSPHGIFVDRQDNVWLSGSAQEDDHILKFTSKGQFLLQIGHAGKNRGSGDTDNLGGPAGLFVDEKTNELYVADGYFNHRVVVFDGTAGTPGTTRACYTVDTSSKASGMWTMRRDGENQRGPRIGEHRWCSRALRRIVSRDHRPDCKR